MTLAAGVSMWLVGGCATTTGGDVPGDDEAPDASETPASADAAPGPELDAGAADAPPGAPMLLSISPEPILVARGQAVIVTVTLDRVAPAGGTMVALSSSGGASLSVPTSALVPAGATSTSFQLGGVTAGGPFELTASLEGADLVAPVRVVPAPISLTPGAADVTAGAAGQYTLTLEAPAPVALDVALASTLPGVAGVPAQVTIPAGQTQATFVVTGVALGGPASLSASFGGATVSGSVRVVGLYLSEVLYDVTGGDSTYEWIELYNGAPVTLDLTGLQVQGAGGAGPAGYTEVLTLSGSLAPGQCVVVGGPATAGITFFQAVDLDPDLGNAGGGSADALRLTTAAGGVIDNVIYGGTNDDHFMDENGMASPPDVPATLINQSIERTAPGLAGPWQVQPTPSPGNCTPISS